MCNNKAHSPIGWFKFIALLLTIIGGMWIGFGRITKIYEDAHIFPLLNKAIDARIKVHDMQERDLTQLRLDAINGQLESLHAIGEHNQARIDKLYEMFGGNGSGMGHSLKAP